MADPPSHNHICITFGEMIMSFGPFVDDGREKLREVGSLAVVVVSGESGEW